MFDNIKNIYHRLKSEYDDLCFFAKKGISRYDLSTYNEYLPITIAWNIQTYLEIGEFDSIEGIYTEDEWVNKLEEIYELLIDYDEEKRRAGMIKVSKIYHLIRK